MEFYQVSPTIEDNRPLPACLLRWGKGFHLGEVQIVMIYEIEFAQPIKKTCFTGTSKIQKKMQPTSLSKEYPGKIGSLGALNILTLNIYNYEEKNVGN